ncbi:MAG TPA: hypothetical protein VML55_00490 [Planctomycetaceae bacterium]|nr:hypothetical protein [Planctomycetaceae bacterium]
MRPLAIAFAVSALVLPGAWAQTQTGGGAGPAVQTGDRGRLGTNHPNAAAGPLRTGRTGTTQTGQSGTPGQSGNSPARPLGAAGRVGSQIANPGLIGPLEVTGPAEGAVPIGTLPADLAGPAVPPGVQGQFETQAGPVSGPLIPGQAAPRVGRASVPPIGRQSVARRSAPNAPPLTFKHGGVVQLHAPLGGDLESGLQSRGFVFLPAPGRDQQTARYQPEFNPAERPSAAASASRQARADQHGQGREQGPERDQERKRVQLFGGRWWFQRSSGEWLVWDATGRQWVSFHPGAVDARTRADASLR